MSSQRYERVRLTAAKPRHATTIPNNLIEYFSNTYHQVSANDAETPISPTIPSSPPPSFRSRASSPTSRHTAVDQNLADTFDADGSDSDEDNDGDDRQRLMRGTPTSSSTDQIDNQSTLTPTSDDSRPIVERRQTHIPVFTAPPPQTNGRVYGGGSGSDGVFANLSAKPERGEKLEEHPPVGLTSRHDKAIC